MKEINQSPIKQGLEGALVMYMETVSPSEDSLTKILSHIPEKKNEEKGRAIRSPYIWLEITEFVMLCSIMIVAIPTLTKINSDPFYLVDKQVEVFEKGIQQEDYADSILSSDI